MALRLNTATACAMRPTSSARPSAGISALSWPDDSFVMVSVSATIGRIELFRIQSSKPHTTASATPPSNVNSHVAWAMAASARAVDMRSSSVPTVLCLP